jgi:hypothetical protein
MTINERFKIIINELYLNNKRSFAIAIGVNPTVVENVVGKRGGNPSYDVIEKVLSANANIDANWLLTGTGSMLRSGTVAPAQVAPAAPIAPAPQAPTPAPHAPTQAVTPAPHAPDASSMHYIMQRYESLVAENALLKKENEELKQSRGTRITAPSYTVSESPLSSHLAAEPHTHK